MVVLLSRWSSGSRWNNCVFFSTGKTGVIGQGTAPVFSPDDFSLLRAFFTGLGKGEDLMEGGRGVLPPHNCGGKNNLSLIY